MGVSINLSELINYMKHVHNIKVKEDSNNPVLTFTDKNFSMKRVRLKLGISGNSKTTLWVETKEVTGFQFKTDYGILIHDSNNLEIVSEVYNYLYERHCKFSIYENIYRIIKFMCSKNSYMMLIERIGVLIAPYNVIYEDKRGFPSSELNPDKFGILLGYRIFGIQHGIHGFNKFIRDINIDLVQNRFRLDDYMSSSQLFVIPMKSYGNGVFMNKYDKGNVGEIDNEKEFKSILKVMI